METTPSEDLAAALDADDNYRVLRRLQNRPNYNVFEVTQLYRVSSAFQPVYP